MTSSDGVTWTSQASAKDYYWWSVIYGNGLFVAVTYSANDEQVMTSPDGIVWTPRSTTGSSTRRWVSVAYGNSIFVAVSFAGLLSRAMSSGSYLLPPAFTLSASSESKTVNAAATGFTSNSTGGAIAIFSINTTPPGMSFNTTTGALTGTPSTVASATTYTITATNTSGTATQTFALTVTAALVTADNSAAELARLAAIAASALEAARKAKEQKELMEILALIPSIGQLTLSLGETTQSLYSTKCVKGKTIKYVKSGTKCPKGYMKKK
jgi:hypothetical protein